MNKLFRKIIIILLIVTISIFFFSFFKTTRNIDNYAYVIALGLDIGSNNNLKLTFQTLSPTAGSSGSGKSSESSSSSSSVLTTSIECSSINLGIQLLNAYIDSKQLNLSHCQSIIFSEELAHNGLNEYIYTLVNELHIYHDANVIVSKCDAEYYLNNSESVYEKLISKYYKEAPTSGLYTGYTHDISLIDFFSALNDSYIQPTSILSSINIPDTTKNSNNNTTNNNMLDNTYKAGESPITSKFTGMEDVGLAVFKRDKLVGELTAIETIAHLMTINKFQTCELSIPNPYDTSTTIDFEINKQKNTKNSVKLINGMPFITTNISLQAKILSMNKDDNYLDASKIAEIESILNLYIENVVYEYLYKTSTEYNCDISGFGKYAKSKFLTKKDWENYSWNKNYKNSFFKVNINCSIISSNLLLET